MLQAGRKRRISDTDLLAGSLPPASKHQRVRDRSLKRTFLAGLGWATHMLKSVMNDDDYPPLGAPVKPRALAPASAWGSGPPPAKSKALPRSPASIYPTPSPTESDDLEMVEATPPSRSVAPSRSQRGRPPARAANTLASSRSLPALPSSTSSRLDKLMPALPPPSSASYTKKPPMFGASHQQSVRARDAAIMSALTATGGQLSPNGEATADREYQTYRVRVEMARKDFNASIPLPSKVSPSGQWPAREQASKDDIMRAFRAAKASREAPRPAVVPLETFAGLKLRDTKLDKELERRAQPRRRFPGSLDAEKEARVRQIMANASFVSTMPGAEVTNRDIRKLGPSSWLNDEVINFYAVMINMRSKAYQAEMQALPEDERPPVAKRKCLRVHCFTSFFFAKLKSAGYDGVRRWTKKVDIFACDVVIAPINMNNSHWVCACVNLRQKRFEFYDSMGATNPSVLALLRAYLQQEFKDKKPKHYHLDLSEWIDYEHSDIPQQENGFDCGVFVSQVMECLSRPDAALDYSQANMPYLRKKMIYEIADKAFLDEEYE